MLRLIGSMTFAWLLMAVSTMAQTAVLDSDGNPLQSGVEYYVLPAATDTAGGLTLVSRTNPCPLYVGQEPLPTVETTGLPVVFTPSSGESVVTEGSDLIVSFSAVSTCVQPTTWNLGEADLITGRVLIVTGAEQNFFRIDKNVESGLYELGYCPNCPVGNCPKPRCGPAGILIENDKRLLALFGGAFPFQFRKA